MIEFPLWELTVVIFSLWTLGTLVSTANGSVRYDLLPGKASKISHFTPNWNFFAPHPGEWDYHLLYRVKRPDESISDWTELPEVTRTPRRLKWGFNPRVYRMKAIFDLGQALTSSVAESDDVSDVDPETDADAPHELKAIESKEHVLSTEYLLLLNHARHNNEHDDADAIQFMLMRSSLRNDEPEPIFVSGFHHL